MIGQGFYPMIAGLLITSVVIAYSDFRSREIEFPNAFLPAMVGFAWFYLESREPALLLVGAVYSILMVLSTWLTLKYTPAVMRLLGRGKKDEDWSKGISGDYLTIGLFSFWPSMIVGVMMAALLIGITGRHYGMWNRGLRTIPLAGLIGLVTIGYILWTAFV